MDSKRARILIAEDEKIVALDLKATLKKLGYVVISTVSTGEEVVVKADTEHPDLILMDIILRGLMNGIQAASQINEKHNIPIIYLTASSDRETLLEAQRTSPFGFISKPYDEVQLDRNIRSALSRITN